METEVNIPLLRKAVEWAEAEAAKPPGLCEWFQEGVRVLPEQRDDWGLDHLAPDCGTCYCVAGYVVAVGRPEAYEGCPSICDVANELLGLGHNSHYLFAADNSIADVRRIAEDLAGERL